MPGGERGKYLVVTNGDEGGNARSEVVEVLRGGRCPARSDEGRGGGRAATKEELRER